MKIKTNKNRKITSIILALAVAFAFLPAMTNADYGKAAKKPGKVTAKTSKKKPGKVKGLKVVKKGKRSVTLKWRKAKRAKKYIVYKKRIVLKCKKYNPVKMVSPYTGKTWYTYSYKTARVGKYKKAKTTKKTKAVIKNLKKNSTYTFKVVAKNKKGKGKFSKEPKIKTAKGKLTKHEKKLMERLTIQYMAWLGLSFKWSTKYPDSKSQATHFEFWYKHNGKWKLVGMSPVNVYHEGIVNPKNENKSIISKKKYTITKWSIGKTDKNGECNWDKKDEKDIFGMRACKGAFRGPFVEYDPRNPPYDRKTDHEFKYGMLGFY